jgi:hypothetical protein
VHRTTLDRHPVPHGGDRFVEPGCAVDDEELGPPQPTADEVVVEDSAPSLGALASHALDREQHLLSVGAHADDDQQRDRGRLAIELTPALRIWVPHLEPSRPLVRLMKAGTDWRLKSCVAGN